MNTKENREITNQQSMIEDLSVKEDQAAAVKGGPVDHTIPVYFHVIDSSRNL